MITICLLFGHVHPIDARNSCPQNDAMKQPNNHPTLPPLDELRWEVRQRLTLLETSLLLSGRVNTVALTSRFGISRAQASKDLALYQKLRPHNLVYDRFLKNYVITERFEPLLVRDTSAEILALLRADLRGEGPLISLAAGMPAVEVLEPVARRIDPQILLPVCRAIYAGEKLRLTYQSLNGDEPHEIVLTPHTLVYNGFRWHVRGYSERKEEFRDYLLARMRSTPSPSASANGSQPTTRLWQTWVTVRMVPHPKLPRTRPRWSPTTSA
jgi:predicted DNA-binding transcriptional regulator YafY